MKKWGIALAALAFAICDTPARADNIPWANGAHWQCAALCSNLAVNPNQGPHTVFTWEINADSTLSAATWYIFVFDAATLPANGAVTPAKCYQIPSGVTQAGVTLTGTGESYPSGIVIAVSTTGCFSLTASTHAFIGLDWQ
jgi:hypothetical protein